MSGAIEIPYNSTERPDTGLYNAKLGVWLFLASEVMLFGALFSTYVLLRDRLGHVGTWRRIPERAAGHRQHAGVDHLERDDGDELGVAENERFRQVQAVHGLDDPLRRGVPRHQRF